ncbi:hypothetical protein AAFF_G00223880 [Aldrovandia affinis]|uniref:SPRY-associated domain-containing protein n=1 Tax=Aldrovandia affinis TaxID=143900 RepID=A0AAD7TAT3_9TELE|nr:hypothetical protein AAFF_G00223880 [Aldrovandia affinis]
MPTLQGMFDILPSKTSMDSHPSQQHWDVKDCCLSMEIEQEIGELKRRNAELKQLLRTQDHTHVLVSHPSTPPCSRDCPDVIVHTDLCVGTVRSVFSPLEEGFREKLRELTDAEFKKIQQYADDVTLDPITAHLNLTVSEDRKEVRYHNWKQNLPANPERRVGAGGALVFMVPFIMFKLLRMKKSTSELV